MLLSKIWKPQLKLPSHTVCLGQVCLSQFILKNKFLNSSKLGQVKMKYAFLKRVEHIYKLYQVILHSVS